jgi:hypothetical protein
MTTIEFTAESLRAVKENWRQEKEKKQAEWRARRDAKRASQTSLITPEDERPKS